MALTDDGSNGMVMPVAPMMNYGGGNGCGTGFGGDWAWILLLLLLGWGNNGNGFGGRSCGAMGVGGNELYPWMNSTERVADGFGNLSTQICGCCGDITSAVTNGFAQAEISNNARQMADMNQNFAMQTALQNCCCDNKAGIADLKYTIASESCADRSAIADALRDVITANTASTQRILDQMCADKIDAKNDTIAQLRSELLYARGQASQDVQTAQILAGQTREIDGIYERLSNCPVPSVPVYGRQNIFTCSGNNNCGCGCGNL